MTPDFFKLWVYLAQTPLLGLTITLIAYRVGLEIYRRLHLNPLANPVLIAIVILTGLLWATGTRYETYFEGAQFVHFLLGPATVALAVPLYAHLRELRVAAWPIAISLFAGSVTAAASAVGLAWVLGASANTLTSIAPKSATAPIAMGVAEKIGGLPSLTAVLVILTGITGAVLGTWTLNALKITDWRARGFAVGLASHGIGTARALQVNPVAGAFASLAMGLNGFATALLLPLLYRWFFS